MIIDLSSLSLVVHPCSRSQRDEPATEIRGMQPSGPFRNEAAPPSSVCGAERSPDVTSSAAASLRLI